MGDFPQAAMEFPVGGCITPEHPCCATFASANFAVVNYAAAAGPATTRAIYIPFAVDNVVTAQQMFWENGGVAGNTDVGIYDINLARVVSSGPTTNAGSIQISNIADTTLTPGSYYMAWLPSTITTQTYWSAVIPVAHLRASGVAQQAVGGTRLPATATFAPVASAYLPLVGISFLSVM